MELSETLVNVCKALDVHKIPYMIIGGQAVLYHGYPRLTEDIDITLGLSISDFQKLLNILGDINCSPLVKNPEDFIKTTWVLPVEQYGSKIKIDFTFSFSEYETEAISNAVSVSINSVNVNFCSLNDLIIHKIFAGRPRDIDDVKNIYLKNKDKINLDYILKWLGEFDKSYSEVPKYSYTKLLKEIIND